MPKVHRHRRKRSTVRQEEKQLVQQTAQVLTEFMTSLEHEFRTPLAILKMSTSMLLRQGHPALSPEQFETVTMIQDAGARLEALTNRLIELTLLETGKISPTYTIIDLAALARQILISTQCHLPQTLQEHFTFALHLRDQEGKPAQHLPLVPGDQHLLSAVLHHLLENAIQFSPQGGRIEIVMGPAPLASVPSAFQPPLPASPCVELCICDYGIGIPQEQLERIFEHFYRIDTSLTREGNGLGLGLTLCRLLLKLHQGYIWAESCEAGGSAFHMWLPLEHVPVVA